MKLKRASITLLLIGTAVVLSGCAEEANRTGNISSFSPIADFAAGGLQGLFVLVVAIINVVFYYAGFHTDLYQQDRAFAYQLGYLIGLLLFLGVTPGFVFVRRRRRARL